MSLVIAILGLARSFLGICSKLCYWHFVPQRIVDRNRHLAQLRMAIGGAGAMGTKDEGVGEGVPQAPQAEKGIPTASRTRHNKTPVAPPQAGRKRQPVAAAPKGRRTRAKVTLGGAPVAVCTPV